jgi:DNA-binding PucR family transcriptional regulator
VHRNTLVQWIARIQDLTGLDVDDPDDRVAIWLAARARAAGAVHGAQPSP